MDFMANLLSSAIHQGHFQNTALSVFLLCPPVCRRFSVGNRKLHTPGGGHSYDYGVDLQPGALKNKSVIWRVLRCRLIMYEYQCRLNSTIEAAK